ncbi:uncharacterized protein LOC117323979 [Pecten maximus]|uniref:uncharacterized protein LOC117323979 n=1 Tax=Pecten maximus TaxID=6579 RepID=UPI001458555D|nr:uncharacterized protein LOC117323979 [Pecten maximus]
MTMKEAVRENIRFSVYPITRLVFVTRLLALLLSPSTMVLGAPSTDGLGSSTKYRFTYNTTDIFVDRVCRRVPVLLDPSAEPLCRIVDMNCIVEDPCKHPDPVERLLSIAPCPPVWEPSLVCSKDIGSNLECKEKLSILQKCFLSPNRPLYNLTTRQESCKLKSACGLWFKRCSEEFSRLTDVFVNCSTTDDVTKSIHLPGNMPSTTDLNDMDNATHPTYHTVRTANMVPGREEKTNKMNIIPIVVGILVPLSSMCLVFLICRTKLGSGKCARRYDLVKTEDEDRCTGYPGDIMGTSQGQGQAEYQNENRTSEHSVVSIQKIDNHGRSDLQTEKQDELLIRWNSKVSDTSDPPQRISDHNITSPDVSGSTVSVLENNETDCFPDILSIDDDEKDKLLPFDNDPAKINSETPGTLAFPQKSNESTSKSESEKDTHNPGDDLEKVTENLSLTSLETSESNRKENGGLELTDNTEESTRCPIDDLEKIVVPENLLLTSLEISESNEEENSGPELRNSIEESTRCPVNDSEKIMMPEGYPQTSLETSGSNIEENGGPQFRDSIEESSQCNVDDPEMENGHPQTSMETSESNVEVNGSPLFRDSIEESTRCPVDDPEVAENLSQTSLETSESNVEENSGPQLRNSIEESTQCLVDDPEMTEGHTLTSPETSESNV